MTDVQNLIERYLAIWNETDATARRAEIEEVWTENGAYIDPLAAVEGRDGIDAVIAAVQQQFPGLVFRLAEGTLDTHHNLARFRWELGPAGGEALAIGFDVAVLADGRVDKVHGFLDKVPA